MKLIPYLRYAVLGIMFLPAMVVVAQVPPGTAPIQVTDMLEIKQPGRMAISPDGQQVAYELTSIVRDEKEAGAYKYQKQVWLAQTTGTLAQKQFTTAPEGASAPAWSPDGKQLIFVRPVDNVPQLFLASLGGGEPVQLTRLPGGAENAVWSPDGKWIAFVSGGTLRAYANDTVRNPQLALPRFDMEKPGLGNTYLLHDNTLPDANGDLAAVRAYLYKNETERKAKVIDRLNFQQEAITSGDMTISQVYIMAATAGAKPRPVTSGFAAYANPIFIPGTPRLLVERNLFDDFHPDRRQERGIFTIDSFGNNLKPLLGDSGFSYTSAVLSASGKWIAYQKGRTATVNVPQVYLQAFDGSGTPVAVPLDRNKTNLTWGAADEALYFTAPSNGGIVLYAYFTATRKLQQLTGFDEGITDFDVKQHTLVLSKHSVPGLTELYTGNATATSLRQLSRHNTWVTEKKISLPEKFVFKNELGQDIEYWVMKPVHYTAGKKYPLLLEIHGGPTAMWGPGETSMWHEFQFFCSKGYGVVYCNPRGSGGYGEAFMRSNRNDWGKGPMKDVLTALEKTVAQGWADTTKLLVTGGSYAGYLVAYILGHDTRFAAACAQRGVYDLRTFFGEGNAWRLIPNYFDGYPWEKATYEVLERESPINYVQNVVTPLIIFHGEQDLRTGVIQSEQYYKSLKVLGRPVEYVRHPGATHEITRSGNNRQRIDQMLRTWEFFERFVGRQ